MSDHQEEGSKAAHLPHWAAMRKNDSWVGYHMTKRTKSPNQSCFVTFPPFVLACQGCIPPSTSFSHHTDLPCVLVSNQLVLWSVHEPGVKWWSAGKRCCGSSRSNHECQTPTLIVECFRGRMRQKCLLDMPLVVLCSIVAEVCHRTFSLKFHSHLNPPHRIESNLYL